jgi:hypothetical protein
VIQVFAGLPQQKVAIAGHQVTFRDLRQILDRSDELVEIDPGFYLGKILYRTGEESYRNRAQEYFTAAGLTGRAKNSVEVLLAQF